jgi:hypothetical protein
MGKALDLMVPHGVVGIADLKEEETEWVGHKGVRGTRP